MLNSSLFAFKKLLHHLYNSSKQSDCLFKTHNSRSTNMFLISSPGTEEHKQQQKQHFINFKIMQLKLDNTVLFHLIPLMWLSVAFSSVQPFNPASGVSRR